MFYVHSSAPVALPVGQYSFRCDSNIIFEAVAPSRGSITIEVKSKHVKFAQWIIKELTLVSKALLFHCKHFHRLVYKRLDKLTF